MTCRRADMPDDVPDIFHAHRLCFCNPALSRRQSLCRSLELLWSNLGEVNDSPPKIFSPVCQTTSFS